MGRKSKRPHSDASSAAGGGGSGVMPTSAADEKPECFCYYCKREFEDEKALLLHQKFKHFKCPECNKQVATIKALITHSLDVHKMPLSQVRTCVCLPPLPPLSLPIPLYLYNSVCVCVCVCVCVLHALH